MDGIESGISSIFKTLFLGIIIMIIIYLISIFILSLGYRDDINSINSTIAVKQENIENEIDDKYEFTIIEETTNFIKYNIIYKPFNNDFIKFNNTFVVPLIK